MRFFLTRVLLFVAGTTIVFPAAFSQQPSIDPEGTLTLEFTLSPVTWTGICADIALGPSGGCTADRVASGGCPANQEGFHFSRILPLPCLAEDIGAGRCSTGFGGEFNQLSDAGVCGVDHPVGAQILVKETPAECQDPGPDWAQITGLTRERWRVDMVDCTTGELFGKPGPGSAACRTAPGDPPAWRWAPRIEDCRAVIERHLDLGPLLHATYNGGLGKLEAMSRKATMEEQLQFDSP